MGKTRPFSEKSALTLFVQTWNRSHGYVPSETAERNVIISVVNKCKQRLKNIEDEERKNSVAAAALLKEYEKKRKAEIEAGHKKTGFFSWLNKLPGSAFKP